MCKAQEPERARSVVGTALGAGATWGWEAWIPRGPSAEQGVWPLPVGQGHPLAWQQAQDRHRAVT